MVKVFLRESASACLEQLKGLCSSLTNACILVPNRTYQQNCIKFCTPNVPIFTPSQWMEILGLRPLKFEESLFLNTYDPFDDPANNNTNLLQAYPESFQQTWLNWMKEHGIHHFSDSTQTRIKNFPFNSVILYGHFETNNHNVITKVLQNLNVNYYQILYDNSHNSRENENLKSVENSEYFQSISTKNTTAERYFVQKFLKENPNTVCVELPGLSYEFLVQKPTNKILEAWLDWQEKGDLSHFLIYLKNHLENNLETFKAAKLKLEQAFSVCLTDDFTLLQASILKKEKHWLENFKQGHWPIEASFVNFIQILQKITPDNFKPFFAKLPSFPFIITKEEFFTYLRRLINNQEKALKSVKRPEEVLYFPFPAYLIPHCIKSHKESTNQRIHSFIASAILDGKKITVCAPQTDNKKEALQNLYPSQKNFEIPLKSKAISKTKTNLSLPPKVLSNLSCKNWERFYLCPLQTWIENILKTQKSPLYYFRIKTKIIGEWVHENLQFDKSPTTFENWLQIIQKNAAVRWQVLKQSFEENAQNMPQVLKTWHKKSLFWAQQMASACQDLLRYELYSEWTLPTDAPFKGRIDLLAIKQNEAIVVDYKTALHYLFTPKQINKGHGLQLWLYGTYLQSIGKSVYLRIIDRFGKSTQLDFDSTKSEVADIESWLNSVQKSGIYSNLPEKKKDTLPLCL